MRKNRNDWLARREPHFDGGLGGPREANTNGKGNGRAAALTAAESAVMRPALPVNARPGGAVPVARAPAPLLRADDPNGAAVRAGVEDIAPKRELLSATGLMEATVRDAQGRKLGEIEDFILDLEAGEIEYVVFSFGGLFGLGNKLCAVSPHMLMLDQARECFRLPYDKARVGNAPEFDKHSWRHLSWSAHPSRIYILRNKRRKRAKRERPQHLYTIARSAQGGAGNDKRCS